MGRRTVGWLLAGVVAGLLLVEAGLRLVWGLGNPVLWEAHPAIGYMPRAGQDLERWGRQFWGAGYGTEAASLVVDWAIAQPSIYRVWAVCDVENLPSARVLEKTGMKREGVLKRWLYHPNFDKRPRDCYVYSIVK